MTLTVIWLLPLVASLLIAFMPPRLAKSMAVLVSLVTLGITIGVALVFAPGLNGYQFSEQVPWIPQLHVFYHLGVDGISIWLVVLNALLTVIAFEAWRSFPFAFLFLTARLQAVPVTLEEAATVDGATLSQRFRYVVFPQLLPTIAVLAVLRFIWTFNSFDDIYLLTGGGAGTEVISVSVFNSLTARGDIGGAAAQALVLAAILAVLIGLYLWRLAPREEQS